MQALSETMYFMYITFRSQMGIRQVAKETCFGKDISLKFACLDAREGERWWIILEPQLKVQFPKIFENVNSPQGINHSLFHYSSNVFLYSLKSKLVV